MFQFVYEVDHVFAHGGPVYAVHEAAALKASILRLHLLNNLLAERTHLRTTRYGHVFVAFIPGKSENVHLVCFVIELLYK